MEDKVIIERHPTGSLGGRYTCVCGSTSGTIYHDTKTLPCEFCGRIYIGHFNKQTGIMESIEYKPEQFQDIFPVNTFAKQQKDKSGCKPKILRPQCQKGLGGLDESKFKLTNPKDECEYDCLTEIISTTIPCICKKTVFTISDGEHVLCSNCGRSYIGKIDSNLTVCMELEKIPTPATPAELTEDKLKNLKFKDIKLNCVVRSSKNTCNINRNRKCTQTNCILMGVLNILTNDKINNQFTDYSMKCKVRTPNNRCSINTNKTCCRKHCVMFNFFKEIEKYVK